VPEPSDIVVLVRADAPLRVNDRWGAARGSRKRDTPLHRQEK